MPVQVGDKCKKGHKIEGDNVQPYINQGKPHVRCKTCNQPPKNKPRKRGDICKNGHVMDGDNYAEKMAFGRLTVYCRRCQREAVRRYADNQAGKDGRVGRSSTNRDKNERQASRRAAERADEMITAGKEDKALNYLLLAKRAERASIALHKKMENTEPNCIDNPGPYVDYPEDNPPTKLQAFFMCQDCPAMVECARFATAYRPAIGVWGGEVYSDGKPIDR